MEMVADPIVAAAKRAIIMGDLNDLPGSLMYQVLEQFDLLRTCLNPNGIQTGPKIC